MSYESKALRGEDFDTLELGEDFNFSQDALLYSEVFYILDQQRNSRRENATVHEEDTFHDVFNQTYEYVKDFKHYTSQETTRAVHKAVLDNPTYAQFNLHSVELVKLHNLGLETADEAYGLIPSLTRKIDRDHLQQLLDDIKRFQS